MRKLVVCAVILLFFGVTCSPNIPAVDNREKNIQLTEGNTLYVGGSGPNNYTKIQDAIDNASDGDTIFVYDDASPYNENIVIDSSLTIIGEDKHTTIINGNYSGNVVDIVATEVYLIGFTIQNSGREFLSAGICCNSNKNSIEGNIISQNEIGIKSLGSDLNTFTNNIIVSNWFYGIRLYYNSNQNNITDNTIISNVNGIEISDSHRTTLLGNNISSNDNRCILLRDSDHNIISDNNITNNNGTGITFISCAYNKILSNNFSNNKDGLILKASHFNKITENIMYSNRRNGISITYCAPNPYSRLIPSKFNLINRNNISNNEYGIILQSETYARNRFNLIFKNNFINNTQNAWDNGYNIENFMNNIKYGNYWSDYEERYPDAMPKTLKPWMWDSAYEIPGGNNKDNCPLVNKWCRSTSLPSSWTKFVNLIINLSRLL